MALKKTLATIVTLATLGLAGCKPCTLSWNGMLDKEYVSFRCEPVVFQSKDALISTQYVLTVTGEDGCVRKYVDKDEDKEVELFEQTCQGSSPITYESSDHLLQPTRDFQRYMKIILFEKVERGLEELKSQSD